MSDSIDFIYNLIKENNVVSLSDCQGSCPCGTFEIRGIRFKFHCWRTRDNCDCKYSGFHIKVINEDFSYSDADLKKLGKLCLESIKERWDNCDWELKIENKQ